MRFPKLAALAALAAIASAPAQAQQTLYNQPSTFPSGISYASQNDTNPGGHGNFATVYDNFSLAASSPVTGATWQGSFFNGSPATITGYTLTFYGDSGGQPGAALATESIVGNANQTFVGTDLFGDSDFNYSAAFSTPFTATAGTQYWLSIVPDLGAPPQWGWNTGTGGDGIAYQDFFGTRNKVTSDMAFSLTGPASTPEPSTVVPFGLVALGLGGLAAARRKKLSA